MLSQTGSFTMEYDPLMIFISVVIASVAATVGLFMLMFLPGHFAVRVGSSFVIGTAVNLMHYTGMASATYYVRPNTIHMIIPGSMAVEIPGLVVAILVLMLDHAICSVGVAYGAVEAATRKELIIMKKLEDGRKLVLDLACPMFLTSAQYFMEMTEEILQGMYEGLRNNGTLTVLDTVEAIASFKMNGAVVVFFSYEWLSWSKQGPNSVQFAMMKQAITNLANKLS